MVRHPHRSSRPAAVPTCLRLVVAVPCLRCSALDVGHSKSNYAMSVEIFPNSVTILLVLLLVPTTVVVGFAA